MKKIMIFLLFTALTINSKGQDIRYKIISAQTGFKSNDEKEWTILPKLNVYNSSLILSNNVLKASVFIDNKYQTDNYYLEANGETINSGTSDEYSVFKAKNSTGNNVVITMFQKNLSKGIKNATICVSFLEKEPSVCFFYEIDNY